jgi:hypothetical protein
MNTTGYTPSPDVLAALEAGDIDALLAAQRARFAGFKMEAGGDAGDGGDGDASGGDAGDGDGTGEGSDGIGDGDDGDGSEDKDIAKARRQAANYRTQLRAAEKAAADAQAAQQATLDGIAKALGLKSDEGADPAAQLTEATTQVASLTDQVATLTAHLLVHELAADAGANPVALLDSQRFTTALKGLDPESDTYRADVAKAIKDAADKNAAYRTGQGSSQGGGELHPDQRERRAGQRPTGLGAAIGAAYSGK